MEKRKFSKRLKYNLLYYFVRSLIFISTALPRGFVIRFYGWLGSIAAVLVVGVRTQAEKNLSIAFGNEKTRNEIRQIAVKMFTMIGKNLADVLRSTKVNTYEGFEKMVEVRGDEYLQQAYDKGDGVISLICHMGAFELFGAYTALKGYKPIAIGTPLKDKKLNDLMMKNRSTRGAQVVERGKDTIKLFRYLKSGGMVCVLIDQDTKVKSRFVNFFGKPAATPIGATLLALKTGARVVPMYVQLENNKQVMRIEPEVELVRTGDVEHDLLVNTQKFNDIIERYIRNDPSQWVWMHDRWKTKPGEEMV